MNDLVSYATIVADRILRPENHGMKDLAKFAFSTAGFFAPPILMYKGFVYESKNQTPANNIVCWRDVWPIFGAGTFMKRVLRRASNPEYKSSVSNCACAAILAIYHLSCMSLFHRSFDTVYKMLF